MTITFTPPAPEPDHRFCLAQAQPELGMEFFRLIWGSILEGAWGSKNNLFIIEGKGYFVASSYLNYNPIDRS